MIWCPLKDWEGSYLISENGDLKRLARIVNYKSRGKIKHLPERMAHQECVRGGYKRFKLSLNGEIKHLFVHRAVALTFIPNPSNKPCINHIDGNPSNNHKSNLEWATYSENEIHSVKILGKKSWNIGKRVPDLFKPVIQSDGQGRVIKIYPSITDARSEGFNDAHISECCAGKRQTHKSFYWQFKN